MPQQELSKTSLPFLASLFLSCVLFLPSCGSSAPTSDVLLQIDGEKKLHEGLGGHVEQFADLDDDGFPEIIASSPYGLSGNYNVFSGGTGEPVYMIESVRDKYKLKNFAVIGDLNGDGIPEVVGPDTWASRGVWVFSGRDGSPMFSIEEKIYGDHYRTPNILTVPDKNSDGVPDIVMPHGEDLIIASGTDGKVIRRFTPPKHTDEDEMVSYSRAADADGDGHDDLIAFGYKKWPLRENVYQNRIRAWFLSADDFRTIGEPFDTPFDNNPDHYACADMNGDGVIDLVGCNKTGGEPSGSLLAAISASDSSEIWRVNGEQVEGGIEMFTVDAKTGETVRRFSDAQFGECMALLPDINADGVPEVATGHPMLGDKERKLHGLIYIFSGSDGSILQTIYPPSSEWRIGRSVAPYEDRNFDGNPDILVAAFEYRSQEREKVGSILILSVQ
jgi:hypothetical protein